MEVRIYYEDTDAAGVVYHANYLKYFERARTEYLREHGLSVAELAACGIIFPVVHMEIGFKAPGLHDDLLTILTQPTHVGGSSFTLRQQAVRKTDGIVLVDSLVKLACANSTLNARRIPPEVRQVLEAGLPQKGA